MNICIVQKQFWQSCNITSDFQIFYGTIHKWCILIVIITPSFLCVFQFHLVGKISVRSNGCFCKLFPMMKQGSTVGILCKYFYILSYRQMFNKNILTRKRIRTDSLCLKRKFFQFHNGITK